MYNTTVIDMVINWNKERYEREFNYDLSNALLFEELHELWESRHKHAYQILDAIGDIQFVCLGILWKAGITFLSINEIFTGYDLRTLTPMEGYKLVPKVMEGLFFDVDKLSFPVPILEKNEQEYECIRFVIHCLFVICTMELKSMGIQHGYYDILPIICKSNNTKKVPNKVVPSHIKANIDKGPNYIPPTEDLRQLFYKLIGGRIDVTA